MCEILKRNTQYALYFACCVFLFLSACAPAVTPTYFIPPTAPPRPTLGQVEATIVAFSTSTSLPLDSNETPTPEATSSPEPTPTPPEQTPTCTNNLKFVEDITIPDGTVVAAGESFVKQWRIQNDGDCDWDSSYLLKLVSGDALGAPAQVALYPARAGAEAIIEMTLIAPLDAGLYHTVWQAFAPDGSAFEQAIYVEVVVE